MSPKIRARTADIAEQSTIHRAQRERGLVLIIAYKFAKGGLWAVLAILMVVLMRRGETARLLDIARHLRHHESALGLWLSDLVVRAASRRGMWTIIVALVVDGVTSFIEGWALLRGQAWGQWLVVVSSGSLLPFECVALVRHVHISRFIVLAVNAVIVAYLARKVLRERAFARRRGPPTQRFQ